MKKIIRIGEKHITNEGYTVEIIRYSNALDCVVMFEDGSLSEKVTYNQLKLGNVKNPNHKSVFGIGCVGNGRYKAKINNELTKSYQTWYDMLRRCYSPVSLQKRPTYKGCSVHGIWLNYQVFAEWFENNYIEGWCLDKDVLFKGNKIYSPTRCCFIPNEINVLFNKSLKTRGNSCIGVFYNKTTDNFRAAISKNGKRHCLGIHTTKQNAFNAYKSAKEKHIKKVADKYREVLIDEVYYSMYSYQVEITD